MLGSSTLKAKNINLKEDYSIYSLHVALVVCLLPPHVRYLNLSSLVAFHSEKNSCPLELFVQYILAVMLLPP